jgi:hypothetical protein
MAEQLFSRSDMLAPRKQRKDTHKFWWNVLLRFSH